jgi:hypothetical protein
MAPDERVAVFHSSGTTEQKPSRHFHNAESLAVYEASLLALVFLKMSCQICRSADCRLPINNCLTPPPSQVPHSSLVHMFETVRQKLGAGKNAFRRVGLNFSANWMRMPWTFDAAAVADCAVIRG